MEQAMNTFQSILGELAEEAIPSHTKNLWPEIEVQLDSHASRLEKPGSNGQRLARKPRFRLVTAIIAAVFILLVLLFATPQGRVLAQNILQFFTRSENNTRILPTPTMVILVGVTQGVPQPTLAPTAGRTLEFSAQCGDLNYPKCSLDQIRAMVDFPVKAITEGLFPTGLDFIGATGGADQVWLVYRSKDLTNAIFLMEGTKVEQGFKGFTIAADTTVDAVQIGEAAGEYVKGAWTDPTNSGTLTWDPDQPDQYLRWTDGGIYYEINAFNNSTTYLNWANQTGLVQLASNLSSTPATPTPAPVNDNLTLAQAEALAGFQLLVPDKLPRDEYTFSHASYSPNTHTVCLVYSHPEDYGTSLSIAETNSGSFPALEDLFLSWPNYGWHFSAEILKVGGGLGGYGQLFKGSLNYDQFCIGHVVTPGGGYSPESEVLQIQAQGLNISIYAKEYPSIFEGNFVTQLELVRLAESLTGVQTIPDEQLDPEYLTDVGDAEAFVGFHIQVPTQLFPGEEFRYFRVVADGLSRQVHITYRKNLEVIETILPDNTLESILTASPSGEKVTVHGQPGLLYYEGGNSISIIWFENGIKYEVYGVYDNQPVRVWLDLAESLK
jgi:hypothetical protein